MNIYDAFRACAIHSACMFIFSSNVVQLSLLSLLLSREAQKMKHFAKREIELQKIKKERENRKAKYVKEAGGLKYTAIAMANRS